MYAGCDTKAVTTFIHVYFGHMQSIQLLWTPKRYLIVRFTGWAFLVLMAAFAATAQTATLSKKNSLAPASGSLQGWPTYGGDSGGMRYTGSTQITSKNLEKLQPAWTFHTNSLIPGRPGAKSASFEATPILFNNLLYISSPFDEVFAVDPQTGNQRWKFDPQIHRNLDAGILTSRGVASWASAKPATGICVTRIFLATMDTRLIALDAVSGQRCTDFGEQGEIDLTRDVFFRSDAPYYNSSPPTVIGDVVVVGSGIVDNTAVDLESGLVRAFDVRSGKQVWSWEPLPWARTQKIRTGAGNTWSVIAADPEHNLVFLPTGAASPDFYGATRPGDDRDANSVVALEASTGRRVWGFQVVHHDLWDYDVAAEPLLFTFHGSDGSLDIPAIAITTKQGLIFVLNRLTGDPLYPVHERPVPHSDMPGEVASPTQPFQDLPSLSPTSIPADAMLGADAQDNQECRALFSNLLYEGIYTPPSERGTLVFPGNLGGVNWGSAAIDPATGILYANTNRYAFSLRLSPRPTWRRKLEKRLLHDASFDMRIGALLLILILLLMGMRRHRSLNPGILSLAGVLLVTIALLGQRSYFQRHPSLADSTLHSTQHFGYEFGSQIGTPYVVERQQIIAPTSKHPCTPLPWGAVSAVNLNTGKAVWQAPLGTSIPGQHTGTVNLGGDLVTSTGLVFTAASEEPVLRAFDAASGEELWKGAIPAPAQATPMSYTLNGKQYIVIAAGGHGLFGTRTADSLVAFALQ